MKFTPTPVGLIGRALPKDAPLAESVCPECPWRKKMIEGFSTGTAADYSMMSVALSHSNIFQWDERNGQKFNYRPAEGTEEVSQCCHMRLNQRCRGAEVFRANIGLRAEASPNEKVVQSEQEALATWRMRGSKF